MSALYDPSSLPVRLSSLPSTIEPESRSKFEAMSCPSHKPEAIFGARSSMLAYYGMTITTRVSSVDSSFAQDSTKRSRIKRANAK